MYRSQILASGLAVLALVATACSSGTPAIEATVPETPTTTVAQTTTSTTVPATTTTTTAPTATTATTAPPEPLIDVADLPDGWSVFTGRAGTFSIGLPLGWRDGRDLVDDPEFAASLEDQLDDTALEELADLVTGVMTGGEVDIALNWKSATPAFVDNVNLLGFPASVGDTLEFALAVGPPQIEGLGGEVVGTEIVQLTNHEAALIEYVAPDLGVENARQYWIITDDEVWVMTFSGGGDSDIEEWIAIASTFTSLGG